MTEETPIEALTAFLVVMTPSGGIDVFTSTMPTINMQRRADLADIESAGQRLVSEAGRMLMRQALEPEEKTTSAIVAEALSRRIDS